MDTPGLEEGIKRLLSSPEALEGTAGLAKSLLGGGQEGGEEKPEEREEDPSGGLGLELDPRLISVAMLAMGELNRRDEDAERLLKALKPYLAPERAALMEDTAKKVRLARAIKAVLDNGGLKLFG